MLQTIERGGCAYIVKETRIIGTDLVVFSAWRPLPADGHPKHRPSTYTYFDGQPWGRIGTDPDRNLFDDLPAYSPERGAACDRAYRERFDFAYGLILEARPELAGLNIACRAGEIEVRS